MKKSGKFISLILVLSLALSLASCGGGEKSDVPAQEDAPTEQNGAPQENTADVSNGENVPGESTGTDVPDGTDESDVPDEPNEPDEPDEPDEPVFDSAAAQAARQARVDYLTDLTVTLLMERDKCVEDLKTSMAITLNGFFREFGAQEFALPEKIDVGREFFEGAVSKLVGELEIPGTDILGDVYEDVSENGGDDLLQTVTSSALESVGSKVTETVRESVMELSGLGSLVSAAESIQNSMTLIGSIIDGTPDYALALTLRDAKGYADTVAAFLSSGEADTETLRSALRAYLSFSGFEQAATDLRDSNGLTAVGRMPISSILSRAEALDRAIGICALLLSRENGELAAPPESEALAAAYGELCGRMQELSSSVPLVSMVEYVLPPNYDRPCLVSLQRGNTAAGAIGGFLGGLLGNAFGDQLKNLSSEDVDKLHGAVNSLTDTANALLFDAEMSTCELLAPADIMDLLFDPDAPIDGSTPARMELCELMYFTGDGSQKMISDSANAAEALRLTRQVYASFLSDSTERDGYLNLIDQVLFELDRYMAAYGAVSRDAADSELYSGLCRSAALAQSQLGSIVMSSQVWPGAVTRQTSSLGTGGVSVGTHKVLVTWRDSDNNIIYASDPKGDITAVYGFDEDGRPMSFTRGEDVILFDPASGAALYTTMDETKTAAVLTFARFLQANRNAFRADDYNAYQRAY